MPVTSEARLDRVVTLHMMGDWGNANLHRICGWISSELWRRSPAGSRFATWPGVAAPTRSMRCSMARCRRPCLYLRASGRQSSRGVASASDPTSAGSARSAHSRRMTGWYLQSTPNSASRASKIFAARSRNSGSLPVADDGVNMVGFAAQPFSRSRRAQLVRPSKPSVRR